MATYSELSQALLKSKNCQEYLSTIINERKKRNPQYSLRSLARDLNVSAATISRVLRSRRSLSVAIAARISKGLNTSESAIDHWHALSLSEKTLDTEASHFHSNRNDTISFEKSVKEIDLESFSLFSEWQHAAILAAADLNSNFNSKKLSQLLDLSPEKIKCALALLEKLKLIEVKGGRLFRSQNNLTVKSKEHNYALKSFHRDILHKVLEALYTQDNEKKYTGSVTLAIDKNQLPELQEMLSSFIKKFIRVAEKGRNKNRIYNLNINLFDLFGCRT